MLLDLLNSKQILFGINVKNKKLDEKRNDLKDKISTHGTLKDNLKKAKDCLEKLIKISGTLGDYGVLMRERLMEITMEGLPENWDGVYEAKTK